MSVPVSVHQAVPDSTPVIWLESVPDLSCKESTGRHTTDDPLLSCKQQVGGSSPPASSQRCRSQACALAYGFPVLGARAIAARRVLVGAPGGCTPARGR